MIKVDQITKKFASFTALDKVTCNIPPGCIYGMVGSNGAGKSTLLRLMTGVYSPESGNITLDGESIYENTKTKNKIAYVPDELYFLPAANMDRMAKLYSSVYEDFDFKRYENLTTSFKLNPKSNLNTFSKGMRRQVATILALSSKPKYLFFDETFDGLDPVMRNLVKSLVCKDVIERDATAIITSHSLRELEDTCDQLALLHKGGLVFESDVQDLKTSLFKIQIAFSVEYDADRFKDLDIVYFSKKGRVTNMIVRGNKESTINKLSLMAPLILDVLNLSLEEVFTYEMEALGYSFNEILEVG